MIYQVTSNNSVDVGEYCQNVGGKDSSRTIIPYRWVWGLRERERQHLNEASWEEKSTRVVSIKILLI